MSTPESIVVLYGGVGSEREVSLLSGEAIAQALESSFKVERIRLDQDELPAQIDPKRSIVFPALHGEFGEDGRLQTLCEARGIEYCGSDAAASRLCIDKGVCKALADENGVPTPKSILFLGDDAPLADDVIEQLGVSLVVKPADQGSSVGLHFTEHRSALGVALSKINKGKWLIEQRIKGRELTVGVLHGAAMGVVEIISASGVYDYQAKYTAGSTQYQFPAELDPMIEARLKDYAERMFEVCGCRDFARVDFLLDGQRSYFLEINTLPGLTATSLLPKSATCIGYNFEVLAQELVAPAMARFKAMGAQDNQS